MNNSASFETIVSIENLQRSWRIVNAKNSAGGIDDVSVKQYAKTINGRIEKLHSSLKAGLWMPTPYLNIDIPKKDGEKRTLSLSVIEDKLVQTAIKRQSNLFWNGRFLGAVMHIVPEEGTLDV